MMAATVPGDVTTVLQGLHPDDAEGQRRLLALVYDELRRMAGAFMRGERPNHTWQPTDLAHEAVNRLLARAIQARDCHEFFAVAARTMQELLVEYARQRGAAKRGGGWQRVPLDDVADTFERQNVDIAALHEALQRLAELNERQSQVVTLHSFGEYTLPETAALLGVSLSTVESEWRMARAWLRGQLVGQARGR